MLPPDDEPRIEDSESRRPRPLFILVTLLLVLAMLASLIWPLLHSRPQRQPRPTPTPVYLQEV
jgi:hypothetical protein